jgi:hypothetical protein
MRSLRTIGLALAAAVVAYPAGSAAGPVGHAAGRESVVRAPLHFDLSAPQRRHVRNRQPPLGPGADSDSGSQPPLPKEYASAMDAVAQMSNTP